MTSIPSYAIRPAPVIPTDNTDPRITEAARFVGFVARRCDIRKYMALKGFDERACNFFAFIEEACPDEKPMTLDELKAEDPIKSMGKGWDIPDFPPPLTMPDEPDEATMSDFERDLRGIVKRS